MKIERDKNALLNKLPGIFKNLEKKNAKVGWFKEQRYDDENSTPVAVVASQNEYGNPRKNIPARPFMRPTAIDKKNEWQAIAKHGAQQVIQGRQTIDDVLGILGQTAAGDIKRTISKVTEPPLSSKTIAARLGKRSNKTHVGSLTKPLIDTGYMLTSLIYVVEDN